MKKSLIALAVAAGSIAAAQADTTTLYGSLGFSTNIAKTTKLDRTLRAVEENNWNIGQDRARLGVKGSEDLSNGLQAIFKFEVQAGEGNNGLNGTRDVYVGLKGDFGQLTIGRQGSTWNTDENYFRTSKPVKEISTPGRANNTIKYTSPDFSGFKVAARIQANGANPASKGLDQWDASVEYEANGFKAAAAYSNTLDTVLPVINVNWMIDPTTGNVVQNVPVFGTPVRNGSTEALGVQLSYENDQYGIFGNVQHQSSANTVYNVQGKYMFDANELRGGIGYTDAKNGRDEVAYGIGYQYNFSKRTSAWIEGAYNTVKHDDNDFTASVGIRHDF